jgi:hypothetical protein
MLPLDLYTTILFHPHHWNSTRISSVPPVNVAMRNAQLNRRKNPDSVDVR